LPKLTNAERTKNLKGGAINFLVACLVPGPCIGACAEAQTASRRHFGANRAYVESTPRCQLGGWEASFRPLRPIPLVLAPTSDLLEDRKALSRPGRFGDLKDRERHSTSSFGMRTSEVVVQPLSRFQPRLDARRKLRLSDGREIGTATMGLRQIDLASGRSTCHTKSTSVDSASSA
jgi:hypothetical protein